MTNPSMFDLWTRYRRLASTTVLACWLWFSMTAAFTHVCGVTGEQDGTAVRSGIACVSCQWASVEKTTETAPAPVVALSPVVEQTFVIVCKAHPYVPSFVIPGRAPPA